MNRFSYYRLTLATILGLLLIVLAYQQWLRIYTPVDDALRPPIPAGMSPDTQPLFVYGTLQWAPLRFIIIGRFGQPQPARLPGFRREGLTIVADAEHDVEGQVVIVNDQELRALDRYERLGWRYQRIIITLDNSLRAWAYQRLDDGPAL